MDFPDNVKDLVLLRSN